MSDDFVDFDGTGASTAFKLGKHLGKELRDAPSTWRKLETGNLRYKDLTRAQRIFAGEPEKFDEEMRKRRERR